MATRSIPLGTISANYYWTTANTWEIYRMFYLSSGLEGHGWVLYQRPASRPSRDQVADRGPEASCLLPRRFRANSGPIRRH